MKKQMVYPITSKKVIEFCKEADDVYYQKHLLVIKMQGGVTFIVHNVTPENYRRLCDILNKLDN